jgi:hypothetical protein
MNPKNIKFNGKSDNRNNRTTNFGMLSVKAGIDNNPAATQADRIAGATMTNKKKKA